MGSRRVIVETREIDPIDEPLTYASPDSPTAWLRRGDGIVAAGDAVLTEFRVGRQPEGMRSATLAEQWSALCADAVIDDDVNLPGTGLVALGALVFDERSGADSVLRVPSVIVGKRAGRSWLTRVRWEGDDTPTAALAQPFGPHWSGSVGPGAQDADSYQEAVRRALVEIARGALSKVVVARDLAGVAPADADLRRLVRALATDYPDTWAFAADGLIGASPETLVTVADGTVTARVLAGTVGRGADVDADAAAGAHLASSSKDLDEHHFAVQSVLASLKPHTRAIAASEQPFVLKLPNLFHLATDVEGVLADASSALDLVGALHPTAAVAGTPTDAAIDMIRSLEPFDRGRYAGPVGWIDATGNGEWAIALRCAQFGAPTPEGNIPVTAYAGAGIVAGSDPESELLETRVKFRPLVDALA